MSLRIFSGFGLWVVAGCALVACGSGDEGSVPAGPQLSAKPSMTSENRPPGIERIRFDPEAPVAGDRIRAVVVARDPDGDATKIGYRWFVDGEPVAVSGPELDLGKFQGATEIELVSVASDGHSESAETRASVDVDDQQPVIVGLKVEPGEQVSPGEAVVVKATARDPDGDSLEIEYEWTINGESASELGSEMSTEGLRMGDEIQVRVTAVARGARSDSVESAPVRVGSTHPEIVSEPPSLREGGVFLYEVEAYDPDGDRILRYRLDAAPDGMTVDPVVGRIEWHPSVEQAGVHQVAVVVSDSAGLETKQSFHVTVNADAPEPPAAAAN
jgi:hypothetical protein